MNKQKRDSYFQKLVANARASISHQVGLPLGCIKMNRLFTWLEYEGEKLEYPVFGEYLENVRALPTGSERLECSRAALRRYDEHLVPINLEYRERIIDACFDIIERYGEGKTDLS
ncbi:MAG TPA: DUF2489 domain-containing protein [Nitrososphaera sp.]|jgi:hypothetical protein|nr:DUF2489 domain-containing protein [Nitrososphaera sp.]